MTLDERIAASLIFYASGEARWRQPNPELRADSVLAECREEIIRLRADVERASTAAQRAAVRELAPAAAPPPSAAPAPRQEQSQRQAPPRSPGTRRDEARAPAPAAGSRATGGDFILRFGRSKGQTISQAPTEDLKWMLARVLEELGDPAKSKWKRANDQLATYLEDELGEREERGR